MDTTETEEHAQLVPLHGEADDPPPDHRPRAEIDAQLAAARWHPRSVKRFLAEAITLATLTPEVARGCLYALPRGGKLVRGKSVRLAQIVAHCWGNLRVQTRIRSIGEGSLVAEAVCLDLERNVAVAAEVRRRTVDSEGRPYSEDMINQTAMAAQATALRNAVFDVVPAPLVEPVFRAVLAVVAGTDRPIEERRDAWRSWLQKRGVGDCEAFAALGVRGWVEVGVEQFEALAGFQARIKAGAATIADIFRPGAGAPPEGPAGREPGEDDG